MKAAHRSGDQSLVTPYKVFAVYNQICRPSATMYMVWCFQALDLETLSLLLSHDCFFDHGAQSVRAPKKCSPAFLTVQELNFRQ